MGNTIYIYKNDLDKACFHMIWLLADKYLTKRTQSDKIFRDKTS